MNGTEGFAAVSFDFSDIVQLDDIPALFAALLLAAVGAAVCLNVIRSIVRAVRKNRGNWKPFPESGLMYSYAAGSGFYHLKKVYLDAHRFAFDRKWTAVSFAGAAYRLGNYAHESQLLMFLCSFGYIPLFLLGCLEMAGRCAAAAVLYVVLFVLYAAVLAVLYLVNLVLMPLFLAADTSASEEQHCPNDFVTFRVPVFACPGCGAQHAGLVPGKTGLLHARCACGRFLPCAVSSGRNALAAFCPKCLEPLPAACVRALTVQVIGGDSAGKTAYIAAVLHQYLAAALKAGEEGVSYFPPDRFDDLETMYITGSPAVSPADRVLSYTVLHSGKHHAGDGLVLYEIPDEMILADQYSHNPLNFGYSDGVILLIDPISAKDIREACKNQTGSAGIAGFSGDLAEDVIVHFINKYADITGLRAGSTSAMPVSVVITKADLPVVQEAVGDERVRAEAAAKQISEDAARSQLCRAFLEKMGLTNALRNLESVFRNISYQPVSAMGHVQDGSPFLPEHTVRPLNRIAQMSGSRLARLTGLAEEAELS